MAKVLVVATSRKTRGGITSVVKAHETGAQWKEHDCTWIETHRDGNTLRKVWYFVTSLFQFMLLLPSSRLVHIHLATLSSARRKVFFLYMAKWAGKKIIVHFHPSNEKFLYNPSVAALYRKFFSKADVVLLLSEQWRRWLRDALGEGIWMQKMQILYNPCPKVHRCPALKQKQILYAGTLLERKGYAVLLRAFGMIAKEYPDWKLAFAGNPYLKDGVNELEDGQRIASELGITDQVRWLGWVSGEKKEQVFNESSIYCLASDGEGFPMGVLDAWAYGIPCVVTPVGGIPDIVHDGVEGLVFPVGDVSALSIALENLIRSEELRTEIVANTDVYVNETFNVQNINRQLGKIYANLLS